MRVMRFSAFTVIRNAWNKKREDKSILLIYSYIYGPNGNSYILPSVLKRNVTCIQVHPSNKSRKQHRKIYALTTKHERFSNDPVIYNDDKAGVGQLELNEQFLNNWFFHDSLCNIILPLPEFDVFQYQTGFSQHRI